MEWLARCAKTRMPLVGLLTLSVMLAGVPIASAAPGTASASSGSGPQYTHRKVETYPMSAAQCAAAKQAHPDQANNSSLCLLTHGVEWTDMQPLTLAQKAQAPKSSVGASAPTANCASGTAQYHDWQGSPDRWWMDLVTNWAWYGNCAVPTITYEKCYIEYTLATDITNAQCYQYTYPATNPDRRAAVYSGHIIEHWPGFDFTYDTFQRRECFKSGSSSCYWTWQ